MSHRLMLTIASPVSIRRTTFQPSADIVRGFGPGGLQHVAGMPTLAVWPCGTLAPAERRSGYVIMLFGSLLGSLIPVVHIGGSDPRATAPASSLPPAPPTRWSRRPTTLRPAPAPGVNNVLRLHR